MAVVDSVEQAVQQIVSRFRPIRIILFGSRAREEARPGSDVDFLVVMPDGTPVRDATISILSELRDADFAKDVVVTTPSSLEQYAESPGMIYRQALREGKVLYDRGAPSVS